MFFSFALRSGTKSPATLLLMEAGIEPACRLLKQPLFAYSKKGDLLFFLLVEFEMLGLSFICSKFRMDFLSWGFLICSTSSGLSFIEFLFVSIKTIGLLELFTFFMNLVGSPQGSAHRL
jgi:hypothetical protein